MSYASSYPVRRAVLAGLLFFAGAIGVAQAQEKLTPVRLRLDWVWQAPQAIFTIADENGYYKEEGLDVTIDRGYGGLDNAAAIAAGNYEFMFGDMSTVILFNSKTPDRKLISVFTIFDALLGTVITRAGNGITKPKDLEGKTIGAPVTDGARRLFPAFAKANGIDPSKINWQTVGIQLVDQQFERGQFDAVAGYAATTLLNLKQLGMPMEKLTIFNFVDYGVEFYGTGIVTRADYAEKNPEIVRKFVRASMRGVKAMLANKEKAIATLKKHDPLLSTEIELDRLNLMIDMALKRPTVETYGVGKIDPQRVKNTIDTLGSVMDVSPLPPVTDIYTDKFIPSEEERKVTF